jgi:hypothetical protein
MWITVMHDEIDLGFYLFFVLVRWLKVDNFFLLLFLLPKVSGTCLSWSIIDW